MKKALISIVILIVLLELLVLIYLFVRTTIKSNEPEDEDLGQIETAVISDNLVEYKSDIHRYSLKYPADKVKLNYSKSTGEIIFFTSLIDEGVILTISPINNVSTLIGDLNTSTGEVVQNVTSVPESIKVNDQSKDFNGVHLSKILDNEDDQDNKCHTINSQRFYTVELNENVFGNITYSYSSNCYNMGDFEESFDRFVKQSEKTKIALSILNSIRFSD